MKSSTQQQGFISKSYSSSASSILKCNPQQSRRLQPFHMATNKSPPVEIYDIGVLESAASLSSSLMSTSSSSSSSSCFSPGSPLSSSGMCYSRSMSLVDVDSNMLLAAGSSYHFVIEAQNQKNTYFSSYNSSAEDEAYTFQGLYVTYIIISCH